MLGHFNAAGDNRSGLVQQRMVSLDSSFLDICIRYLRLRDIEDTPLFSSEYLGLVEVPQESDLFQDNGERTTMTTTVCGKIENGPWSTTTRLSEASGSCSSTLLATGLSISAPFQPALLTSLDDTECLCRAGSMRLRNWTTPNCRPVCRFKARFDFDSDLYDAVGCYLALRLRGPASAYT